MCDANRPSTPVGSGFRALLAGVVMLTSCQRQPAGPELTPEPAPPDSALPGAETAPPASTLVPLFGTGMRYAGTTTVQAFVTVANQPTEVVDSIETLVWFRLNDQSLLTPGATTRVLLHLDSARTVTRGRSRLPRQQVMRGEVSYELTADGTHTTIVPVGADSTCAVGTLASMVALQLPLPIFSSTRAWSDSLRYDGCTSMISTRGEAVVDYLPVDGSRSVVRRRFTLASEGAGIMDSVSVHLSTTSHGDGRIALQLDSLGRLVLLSLSDSITTELAFASEFGTQRFLQTAQRTTEVVAAADSGR